MKRNAINVTMNLLIQAIWESGPNLERHMVVNNWRRQPFCLSPGLTIIRVRLWLAFGNIGDIWKRTVEKSQTNVTLPLPRQAQFGEAQGVEQLELFASPQVNAMQCNAVQWAHSGEQLNLFCSSWGLTTRVELWPGVGNSNHSEFQSSIYLLSQAYDDAAHMYTACSQNIKHITLALMLSFIVFHQHFLYSI